MTEDEVQCERRKRLAGWVSEHGGASTVCHKRGLPKATESYISQILGGYSFGARAARNMEAKLGMPGGFLEPTYAFRKYQPPQQTAGTEDLTGSTRAIFTLDKAPGSSNPNQVAESDGDMHTPGHEIKRFDTGGAMGHGVVLKDQPGVIE